MTQAASHQEPTQLRTDPSLLAILPWLAITVIVSVVLSLAAYKYAGPRFLTPKTVVFDIVKYNNAQQRLVGQLLQQKGPEVSEAAVLIKGLSGKAKAAIDEIAGPSAVVLVRQGVVSAHVTDITDKVLAKLGLPTDVPTLSAADPGDDLSFFLRSLRPAAAAAPSAPAAAKPNPLP